jgi:hypothetical protein
MPPECRAFGTHGDVIIQIHYAAWTDRDLAGRRIHLIQDCANALYMRFSSRVGPTALSRGTPRPTFPWQGDY